MLLSYDNYKGKCEVDMHGQIVIVSNGEGNKGKPIADAIKEIAELVCNKFEIPYNELHLIEYRVQKKFLGPVRREHFKVDFEVRGNRFLDPKWTSISEEEIIKLINSRK